MGDIRMIELKSMAVAMPDVRGHPNRRAFRGVLTMVDVASERAPSGSKGHRVMLRRRAAEEALASLLGMALDYSPALDRHDVRCKVGVITRADIVGRNVELGGYLYARDFPEVVEEIAKGRCHRDRQHINSTSFNGAIRSTPSSVGHKNLGGDELKNCLLAAAERLFSLTDLLRTHPKGADRRITGFCAKIRAEACAAESCTSGLGLSYEVTEVEVEDPREKVWKLSKVTFTGAAILRKNKAAYQETWIELD
jgi:hypothetical protein